jgi:hypothetical protein
MKKVIITISTILTICFLTASAYAWDFGGISGSRNYNNMGYNNVNYQSFMAETQALRSSIAADRAELNALMSGSNPDSKRARILSEQISRSENELRLKAQQKNIPGMGMMGYGQGQNMGMRSYNGNYMRCW